MAIDGLQAGSTRIGNIRLGEKKVSSKGKEYPAALDKFRLTSDSRFLLEQASSRYGGTVEPWDGHPGQFEITLEVSELPFMASEIECKQWYELWKASGCERRCTGTVQEPSGAPCVCDPEARECKLTTYLWIRLCELNGVGVWQLVTHGFYAATEIPESMKFLTDLARNKRYPKCTLAIQQREKKVPAKDGKESSIKKFIVPTILIPMSMDQLLGGPVQAAIESAKQRALPPGDDKPTFRKYLIKECADQWANLVPVPASIALACGVDPATVAACFTKDGRILWQKFSNEQLYMAESYAASGQVVSISQEHVAECLAAMKKLWEEDQVGANPTADDTTLQPTNGQE